ncbi:E2 domain-associated cysteine-rich protein [Rubellimicrobium aerolatum]|uniref:E2 domain-associated cysteine-rich protein n=1 Tax=Rubellimicrobium aerolatum TaxID=490979 RepID=A0ABW0S8Q5_9RHOB
MTAVRSTSLEFILPVPRPGGTAPVYNIIAEIRGDVVAAREAEPVRLPAFCPERHINRDGSFCLGWDGADDLAVRDEETARAWWRRLFKFLSLQERAARRRRWPDRRAWPHGDAARHQLRAEMAAHRLGSPFTEDLAQERLEVIRKGRGAGGHGLRVQRDGRRLYSVWEGARRAVNLRQRCLCALGTGSSPAVLRGCGDHADAAVELAFALRDRDIAEQDFWAQLKGTTCCGTMDGCPLSSGSNGRSE